MSVHAQRRSSMCRSLTYVAIAAVQDRLIAPAVLADARERMNNTQAELLALLGLVHGDILDMAHAAKPTEKLALDEDSAHRDDSVRGLVDNDDGVVCARCSTDCFELCAPCLFTRVGDDSKN